MFCVSCSTRHSKTNLKPASLPPCYLRAHPEDMMLKAPWTAPRLRSQHCYQPAELHWGLAGKGLNVQQQHPNGAGTSSHVGAWEIIQTRLFILMLVSQMPSVLLGTNGLLSPQYSFFSLLNLRFLFYIKTSALWLFLLLSALQRLLKSDSTEHVLWDFQISRAVVNFTPQGELYRTPVMRIRTGQAGWRLLPECQGITHRTIGSLYSRDRQNRPFTKTSDFHLKGLITKLMKPQLLQNCSKNQHVSREWVKASILPVNVLL